VAKPWLNISIIVTHSPHELPNRISIAYSLYLKIVYGYPILVNLCGDNGKQSVRKGSANEKENSAPPATITDGICIIRIVYTSAIDWELG
jgi:hypothetical protein